MYARQRDADAGVLRLLAYNLLQLAVANICGPQAPSPAEAARSGPGARSCAPSSKALTRSWKSSALAGDVTTPTRTGEPLRLLFDIRRLRPREEPARPWPRPLQPQSPTELNRTSDSLLPSLASGDFRSGLGTQAEAIDLCRQNR